MQLSSEDHKKSKAAADNNFTNQLSKQSVARATVQCSLRSWFHAVSIWIDFLEGSDDIWVDQFDAIDLVA